MTPNDKKKSLEWPKWPGVIQVMEGGGRGGGGEDQKHSLRNGLKEWSEMI